MARCSYRSSKVTNQGEFDSSSPPTVPSSITYSIVAFSSDGNNMTLQINYGQEYGSISW